MLFFYNSTAFKKLAHGVKYYFWKKLIILGA